MLERVIDNFNVRGAKPFCSVELGSNILAITRDSREKTFFERKKGKIRGKIGKTFSGASQLKKILQENFINYGKYGNSKLHSLLLPTL